MTDEVITLPSGTEVSIEAALGDLSRATRFLASMPSANAQDHAADLERVAELIRLLKEEEA